MAGFAFLEHQGTLALAHRGGNSDHPENTLESFQAAIDLGYRYVETDVHASADDVLYAFHDPNLARVAGVDADIGDLDSASIDAIRFDGYRIPRFDALLDSWPTLFVNIDPKADAAVGPLVEAVARHGATERVCIGSFSDRRIAHCRDALGSGLCTSMGPKELGRLWLTSRGVPIGDFVSACAQVPRFWSLPLPAVPPPRFDDRNFIDAAQSRGIPVHVWTINDADEMHELVDLGVDGIMTDDPALLRNVLRERNRWETDGD